MHTPRALLWAAALWCGLFGATAHAEPGTVTVPLSSWETTLDQLHAADVDPVPPVRTSAVGRVIEGRFRKGVFSGSLVASFDVLPGEGHVRVPVLDSGTSISEVLLDGRPTSLLRDGAMYTVGVDQPGTHRIEVRFFQGRESDRFARKLAFDLPPSGPTALRVWVPEQDIDASLTQGAVTGLRSESGGTWLEAALDARGQVDLTWTRQHDRTATADAKTRARVHTLFTLHEALVRGVQALDLEVVDGEIDRFELELPPDIEIVDVSGDAVLQWQTEGDTGGSLTILLRYLVPDQTSIRVQFQFPVELDRPVNLRMPVPAAGVPFEGTAGVQGPAGLEVTVQEVAGATEQPVRDLPPALTELTASPLLLGYAFSEDPRVTLGLARHAEVPLTTTLIDDVQSSTVLLLDGSEITKLRMKVRNNTRQYLGVTLPDGATLTHLLIDGQPVRPGVTQEGGVERLLVPLRQSERLGGDEASTHVVQPGDTLGEIALLQYGDASQWRRILLDNPGKLSSPEQLAVGQALTIKPRVDVAVQERAFVVEIAYERAGEALGALGRRSVSLPELDVDTVSVTWHLFVPTSVEPLAFSANLTQLDLVRYGPVTRVVDLLGAVLGIDAAWAGSSGEYVDILSRRKAIYWSESMDKAQAVEAVSAFPLVGERVRFERILMGTDTPRVSMFFLADALLPWLRGGAFLACFGLVLSLARGSRRRRAAALVGIVLLFGCAHYLNGVHRRMLWATDLALGLALVQARWPVWRTAWTDGPPRPRALLAGVGWRTMIGAIGLLMLANLVIGNATALGVTLFVGLVIGLRRSR